MVDIGGSEEVVETGGRSEVAGDTPAPTGDIDNFVTGRNPVIAKIDIGRTDGWKVTGRGEGRELSVCFATLRGAPRQSAIHPWRAPGKFSSG